MFNPIPVVQATFAVAWVGVGLAGAWLGVPWSEADRSTLFVFFGLVSLGGGAVGWTGTTLQKAIGVVGALFGTGGVVSYFLQARGTTIALFLGLAVVGVALLVLSIRAPEPDTS